MEIVASVVAALYTIDLLLLAFFGLHCLIMIYLYRKNGDHCRLGALGKLEQAGEAKELRKGAGPYPFVTVQLPIYNEYNVVERLLRSVAALHWPPNRLEIQVLDDSTDGTRQLIQRLVRDYRRKGLQITALYRKERRGFKAGALHAGLSKARGEYIAIFDADFIPPSDFLLKTVPLFANSEIGMVQTRWGHTNRDYSLLTRAQALGVDGHFIIEQAARNGSSLWMNFNGTAGIWRRSCILEAGNWQADTLTEDFDISYRAEMAGWKFRYLKDVVSPAELPATVTAFKSQQFRWCKGSIQTAVKLIPRIWRSDFSKKIKAEAFTHLLNYSVHPLLLLNVLLTLPMLLLIPSLPFDLDALPGLALAGLALILSVGFIGPFSLYINAQQHLYSDWRRRILWLPALIMIGTGVAVNNSWAYIEALLGRQSAFHRTPKLGLESPTDNLWLRIANVADIKKGNHLELWEFCMGLYTAATILCAIIEDRFLPAAFLAIYAAGFFYMCFGSLWDRAHLARLSTGRASAVGA